MYKIFLAVGHRELENFLKSNKDVIERKINDNVKFVGEVVYREGILQGIADFRPDVVLIREGLQGKINLTDIIYKIKVNYPDTRIIFIAGDREVGDALLATLVQLGIYDLIIGSKVNAIDMLKKIVTPNTLADVAQYLPKVTVDEKTNTKIFDAPDLAPVSDDTYETTQEEPIIKPLKPIKLPQNNQTSYELYEDEEEDIYEDEEDYSDEYDNDEHDNEGDLLIIDEETEPKGEEVMEEPPKRKPIKTIPLSPRKEEDTPLSIDEHKYTSNYPKTNSVDINMAKEKPMAKINSTKKTSRKVEKKEDDNKLLSKIFGKKEMSKRIGQQVITFVGGKGGVGNSQLAFNTALKLAQDGYKTIYIDLNDSHSAIDCIFQLGYADVGIESVIKGLKEEDYFLIERSIVNINKILPDTVKENYLYKTYNKMPSNLDFLFFSQRYMENNKDIPKADCALLKDLNIFLLMQEGYDAIIIDTPYDIFNRFTEKALIYSNKIFFTITQDYSVIGNHLNQIKLMDKKRIKFREKFYYLLNKYENADISTNDVYKLLVEALRLEGFSLITVPNMNKEFINANYLGIPILWYSKNKDIQKAFSEIQSLIIR